MIGQEPSLLFHLDQIYTTDPEDGPTTDPPFASLLARMPAGDDAELAELIEADGRARIRVARPVALDRYLDAVPDLPRHPDALDAAIDMALRWLTRTGRPSQESVDQLIQSHPTLQDAIRDAAALGNALCSTTHVRATVVSESRIRTLPFEFGPLTPIGTPRYQLQRLLGEGAFGQVYLAVDRQMSEAGHEAMVSIKVLTSGIADAWARQRLIDEATKARRIDHPNVVRVLDRGISGEDEDFVVYEYVDGGDLARWVRRRKGTVEIDEAVRLTAAIARGVHAAHMAGLVHCDLKPANIMMTAEGVAKVADFGIAIRATESTDKPAGSDDSVPLGNLAFISPEQFRMEPGSLTVPSDLYAIGGVLYWLLCARLPNGNSYEEIARAHDPVSGRREPPSPRAARADIDTDLAAICGRAMAIRPEHRYASAAAFADDLEAWLRREAIAWTGPTLTRRIGLWIRRRPGIAAMLAIMTLLVGGGLLTLQWMRNDAAARRFELALTEQKLEGEAAARRVFKENLDTFGANLRAARDEGIATDLLPKIWLMEWLYGPTVLAQGVDSTELWLVRIDVIRQLVAEREDAGEGDTLEALFWKTALGFWLLNMGETAEAETILTDVEARWSGLLRATDPWLEDISAMRTCARVIGVAQRMVDGVAPDVSIEELESAAVKLEAASTRLARTHERTPLDRLVTRTLRLLYGPGMLDRRERLDELAER